MEAYLESIQIKKIEETEERLSLRIDNINASVVNAIRRTVISDCPTIAIEWVFIEENTSVMPDEMLSHRLGLVPLIADPNTIENVVRTEEFNPLLATTEKNSISFELLVENSSSSQINIYSDHIKLTSSHTNVQLKPGVLITRLAPKEKIRCKIIAIRGIGREHSKWSPASVCYYRFIKQVTFKNPAKIQEMKKYFRSGLILSDTPSVDENTLQMNTDVVKDFPDAVEVKILDNSCIFEIESISEPGQSILARSFDVLRKKLTDLQKEVEKAAESTATEQRASYH
ncbi:DNA-directed RNA polymerases I and III subunit RPAC1 [Nematocida sp. LUAm2]|nr:DNA-directed RNA polymerases I and III subunit RPAC1 [Nematocida sp. LUAm2]